MAEALDLDLPGRALMPETSPDLLTFAREAEKQAVKLPTMPNMKPREKKDKKGVLPMFSEHAVSQ